MSESQPQQTGGRSGAGGDNRPLPDWPPEAFVIRHEEEADARPRSRVLGFLRARKRVRVERIDQRLPANVEELAQERIPVGDGDSGRIETMADGSISIPLYEEELVVTKRIVLRERVVIRKETVQRHERVASELRREEVEIDNPLGELGDER